MVWKALEALGMLSEALGSFDVNTVCPLPGSWINHVPFTFVPGCRQSHVLCIFVCIVCRYLCDSVLVPCSLWQQFLSRVDISMQFYGVF